MYSNRSYLCSPAYHCQNRVLLSVMARLTGDSYFAEYAEAWHHSRLSASDRAEIYLAFQLTKNASRFRSRTASKNEPKHCVFSSAAELLTLPGIDYLHVRPEVRDHPNNKPSNKLQLSIP